MVPPPLRHVLLETRLTGMMEARFENQGFWKPRFVPVMHCEVSELWWLGTHCPSLWDVDLKTDTSRHSERRYWRPVKPGDVSRFFTVNHIAPPPCR